MLTHLHLWDFSGHTSFLLCPLSLLSPYFFSSDSSWPGEPMYLLRTKWQPTDTSSFLYWSFWKDLRRPLECSVLFKRLIHSTVTPPPHPIAVSEGDPETSCAFLKTFLSYLWYRPRQDLRDTYRISYAFSQAATPCLCDTAHLTTDCLNRAVPATSSWLELMTHFS